MLFINYRKDDTRYLARALAESLRHRFGPNQVFLDESSISDGAEWPSALMDALRRARAVLSLVGPAWLKCWDEHGRRRIDDPDDWVRKELKEARSCQKAVLIRNVGGNTSQFKKSALPKDLHWLADIQSKNLVDTNWYEGVDRLMRNLIDEYGFIDVGVELALPRAAPYSRKTQQLSSAQLLEQIATLKGWEPFESAYPPRKELRKLYMFDSFEKAVGFLKFAAPFIQKNNHHPRWENQFRTVTVYFSTWDAGCQVTQHDIHAARLMDEWYDVYQSAHGRGKL